MYDLCILVLAYSSGSQTISQQGPLNWHKLDHGHSFEKILSQVRPIQK